MRRALVSGLAALVAGTALAQQIPADDLRALQPYGEFRSHTLLSWHPEGKEILAARRAGSEDSLYRVAGAGAEPQAVAGVGRVLAAAYSPTDGEAFLFIAEGADGSQRLQRYVLASGAVVPISPADEQALEFTWNASGDRLAYATVSEDPARRGATLTTLRIVEPARAGSERQLARLEGRWKDLRFAPNGRTLALTQEVSPRESHLWVVEVANAKRRRVTRLDPRAPAQYRSPAFTRDGRSLLALSDRGSEFRRLVILPLAKGSERALTAHLAYDVDAYAVSDDAGLLAFVTNERGAHVVRFIDLVTLKEQPRPPLLDGVVGGLAWRPKSRELGLHIASARSPGDVYSYEVKSNQLTRWTNGNAPAVNTREFAEPRRIAWKSFDGRELTGLLYEPPARFTGKRPVIVDFRIGPGSQWRAGFLGRANYLMSELGVAILRPNLRGASGFGKSFLALGTQREAVQKDLQALLEWIGNQPGLDESRTVVLGSGASGQPDEDTFIAAAVDLARRAGP